MGLFGGQTLNPINKLLLMLTDTIVWLMCLYSLHLVSTSPKAAVGAEGYEMTMLWGHTGAQACFVVVQECADERLKSKMQTHCFLQALVFGLSRIQCLTVSLSVVSLYLSLSVTPLDTLSCPDSLWYLPSFLPLSFSLFLPFCLTS